MGFLGKLCFVERIKFVPLIASTRIRTSDHLLKRELLYHLSYGGVNFFYILYSGKSKANMPGPVRIRETAMASFISRSVRERGCFPRSMIELAIIIMETTIAAAWVNKPIRSKIPLAKTIPPKILWGVFSPAIILPNPRCIKGTLKAILNTNGARNEKLKSSGNKLGIFAL